LSEAIVRKDRHGRPIPLIPRNDAEFRGFFSACDPTALLEACEASDDERLQAWAKVRQDPKNSQYLDVTLAQKCQVTLKNISQAYLDYRREQGMVELANRIPQAMADIGDDALSKRRRCPKCRGVGELTIDGEMLECEDCWGTGMLVKSGDPDARKAMLEAAKITGNKGPLVAQQFNFDGGFSVEGMISQGEKLMGGK
jgi:hypothetical protein